MRFSASGLMLLATLLPLPLSAQPVAEAPPAFPQAPYDPAAPIVRDSALAWIRENAQAFEGHLDTAEIVRPLLDRLDGSRVIGIGELSHGDRESALTKIAIARGLIEQKGVRLVGLEASIESGLELNRYVLDRSPLRPDELERAAATRVLLDASLYDIWQNEPFRDFLVWLRRFNLSAERPVRFANFDGTEPGTGVRLVLEFIRSRATGRNQSEVLRELAEIETVLAPLLSPDVQDAYSDYLPTQTQASVAEHANQIGRLRKLLEQELQSPAPSDDAFVYRLAMSEITGFFESTARRRAGKKIEDSFKDAFSGNTNSPSYRESVTRRDRDMAQAIIEISRQNPGERYILFAHNSHVERNGFDGLDFASYALSMGRFLQAEFADEYAAINFVTAGGSFTASFTSDVEGRMSTGRVTGQIAENPYSLGAFYRKVGPPRFWVDLRLLPGMEPWAVSWRSYPFVTMAPGNTWVPHLLFYPSALPVANGVDITIFFDHVSPVARLERQP